GHSPLDCKSGPPSPTGQVYTGLQGQTSHTFPNEMRRGSLLGFGEVCLPSTLFLEEAHRITHTQPSTPRSQQFPDSAYLEMLHGTLTSSSSGGAEAAHLTRAAWPAGEERENWPHPPIHHPSL
ncbi:hypothetical protein E2320_000975, partial [Naja naja]